MYTSKDILSDLDSNAIYEFFLDLEHGYFFTSGSRINLFADNERWAIVFEKSGYGNRTGCAEIWLDYLGNCIVPSSNNDLTSQFISNTNQIVLIDNNSLDEVSKGFELVAKDVKTIKVREQEVKIEQDITKYNEKKIEIQKVDNPNNQIDFPSFLRLLNEEHPELFKASKEELYEFLPNDLPFIMSINRWNQTEIKEYGGPNPSENETFQLISEILATKEKALWKPTLPSNNDWRNWPNAGGL